MLVNDSLRNATLLVYANKQDCKNALRADTICDKLGLQSLPRSHEWYIQSCSALTGDGIIEGLEWLNKALKSKARSSRAG